MRNRAFWLLFIILGMFIFVSTSSAAGAQVTHLDCRTLQASCSVLAESSFMSALSAEPTPGEPGDSRQLPPVGSNAGLVIGASILVLIIIGGVLSSRRKQNH